MLTKATLALFGLPEDAMPCRCQNCDWRGDYDQWQATPVALDQRWGAPAGQRQLVLTDYICRYGFCIDIDPAVAQQATAALREPGSYYAYGRIGLLLVSPRQQKVYYLING